VAVDAVLCENRTDVANEVVWFSVIGPCEKAEDDYKGQSEKDRVSSTERDVTGVIGRRNDSSAGE
jgi:hypothetical protein